MSPFRHKLDWANTDHQSFLRFAGEGLKKSFSPSKVKFPFEFSLGIDTLREWDCEHDLIVSVGSIFPEPLRDSQRVDSKGNEYSMLLLIQSFAKV